MFSILAGEKKRDEVERVIKGGVMATTLSTRLTSLIEVIDERVERSNVARKKKARRIDRFCIRLRSIIFD